MQYFFVFFGFIARYRLFLSQFLFIFTWFVASDLLAHLLRVNKLLILIILLGLRLSSWNYFVTTA